MVGNCSAHHLNSFYLNSEEILYQNTLNTDRLQMMYKVLAASTELVLRAKVAILLQDLSGYMYTTQSLPCPNSLLIALSI